MPITDSIAPPDARHYVYQDPTVFNQAAPVQNTWYTIATIAAAFRIYNVIVQVETDDETLEIQALTLDGVLVPGTDLACTAGNLYYGIFAPTILLNRLYLSATNPRLSRDFYLEGKQIELQMRKITALGAGDLNALIISSLYE